MAFENLQTDYQLISPIGCHRNAVGLNQQLPFAAFSNLSELPFLKAIPKRK